MPGPRKKLAAIKRLEGDPAARRGNRRQGSGRAVRPEHLMDDARGCIEVVQQSMPPSYSRLNGFTLRIRHGVGDIRKRAAFEIGNPDFEWRQGFAGIEGEGAVAVAEDHEPAGGDHRPPWRPAGPEPHKQGRTPVAGRGAEEKQVRRAARASRVIEFIEQRAAQPGPQYFGDPAAPITRSLLALLMQ